MGGAGSNCDFHRVRMAPTRNPLFSRLREFKDRKKSPETQGFPEGKTEGRNRHNWGPKEFGDSCFSPLFIICMDE